METIITLFQAANSLTPLAIIGLLVGILYILLWKQPLKKDIEDIQDNDLHELPDMAATLRRIEISQTQAFATIIARLNGR